MALDLSDYPSALTTDEKFELRRELRIFESLAQQVTQRRKHAERHLGSIQSQLQVLKQRHAEGNYSIVGAATSSSSSPSTATATAAGTQPPSSGADKKESGKQDGNAAAGTTTSTASASAGSAPPSAPRVTVSRNPMFSMMKGMLQNAKRHNESTESTELKKRRIELEAQARKKQMELQISMLEEQLVEAQEQAAKIRMRAAAVTETHNTLRAVCDVMEPMELKYCTSFFLRCSDDPDEDVTAPPPTINSLEKEAEGVAAVQEGVPTTTTSFAACTIDVSNHVVHFVPAHHTDKTEAILAAQIEGFLSEYLEYREHVESAMSAIANRKEAQRAVNAPT